MKLFHLSDLHLGKREHEFSLLEDQEYILNQILELVDVECPHAVLIAGDIYDRPVPPAEAVRLFDDFLCGLVARGAQALVISGNHDSPERLAFGSRLMSLGGAHLSPVYDGHVEPVTLRDEHGAVDVFLLPFIKPIHVRRYYPDEPTDTVAQAVRTAIAHMPVDASRRSVLLAHQFVTGAARTESEELNVGGEDNVDASAFDPFDYVALGHVHGAQAMGRDTVRYCGTPLKYSFSEARQQKSVTVVELGAKGDIALRMLPLTPLRDMRELRGAYMELTTKSFYAGMDTDDYLRVTLTDEQDVPYAAAKLGAIYPNIMQLLYDNKRTRAALSVGGAAKPERRTPMELYAALYQKQNGQPMSVEQARFIEGLIRDVWEGEV